jgi:membrane fusion protein, multidrug efflux system
MKRAMKWALVVLALLVLGGLIARALIARKTEQARLAVPSATPAAVDLSAGDVLVVRPVELVRTLAISGGLKAVESAIVKARVAAEVAELTVREGDRVKAGQSLGRLDATEFTLRLRQAEQQAASAKAQLDIAERALTNNRALVEQGFISKNALDTSVMSMAGARASLQAAEATADLARKAVRDTEIRAPLSGIVSQRLVQPGERVPLDARLLEIVDLSRIELEAAVSPDDVGSVQVGSLARLQVDGLAQPVAARVVRINPSTQAGTRSVMTYLALEPQAGLRQGLFARGAIELQRQTTIAVPASAVRVDQARPYVLVVASGKIVQRFVTTGVRGEAMFGPRPEAAIEISAGLQPGDTVLLGSVGTMRDGALARLPAATASSPPAAQR